MTVHDLTVARLADKYPQARKRGFASAVRKFFRDAGVSLPTLLPDLWWYGEQSRSIGCLEIEDGHPLSADKLLAYAELEFWLEECADYSFWLFVTDRWASKLISVPLSEYLWAERVGKNNSIVQRC